MGAKLVRISCFTCSCRGKKSSQNSERSDSRCTGEQIICELRTAGIIRGENSDTAATGVAFRVMEPQEAQRRPRRLPKLKRNNKVHPVVSYNVNERLMMAEIRRDEALADRGRMGREYETRRQAVLQRKQENLILEAEYGNE